MFCFKCGAELPDGAGFCSSCGASLNSGAPNPQAPAMDYQAQMVQMQQMQAQQYQMQKNSIRQSEIASLANCYEYFNQKRETFQEYDRIGQRVNYYARGAKSALIVWGAIIAGCNLVFLMGLASSEPPASVVFIFLIGLLAGGAMIFGGVMNAVNHKEKAPKAPKVKVEKKKIEKKAAPAPVALAPVTDDDEIIAVIAAAVNAMYEGTGKKPVIRAIRQSKQNNARSAWGFAGVFENTRAF